MLSTSARVALLLLFASGVHAIRCFSCATANTADKWGPNSSWRFMYKGTPLDISDDCLAPSPAVSSVECPSSCFRVNHTETTLEDGHIFDQFTIRGCVDRMFERNLSESSRNKTGCQSSTLNSSEIEKQTEVCYCDHDYCNSHRTIGNGRAHADSKDSSSWIAISCLVVGLFFVVLIGYCLCRWKKRLESKKPFWVAGIFPAHAHYDDTVSNRSLLQFQCETDKLERELVPV